MNDDAIKRALKLMPYGFYGISSRNGDDVNAMVANWLTQASFEPRLLALGLQKTSYTYGLVEKGRVFAVNIFHKEDSDQLTPFSKGRSKRPDKMEEAEYEPAPETGCPILAGAAAFIECKVTQIVETTGDHNLIIGEVVGAGVRKEGEVEDSLTLMHMGWSYSG